MMLVIKWVQLLHRMITWRLERDMPWDIPSWVILTRGGGMVRQREYEQAWKLGCCPCLFSQLTSYIAFACFWTLGNVHYSLGSAGPPSVITSSPTKTPTQAPVTPSPTTSKPTSSPSVSPSRTPTKSPTHTPVTQPPSSKPTVQPATSKPTLSPTKSPVPAPPSPPSSNGNGSDNGEPSPTSPSPTTAKPTSNSNPTPPTDSNTPSPSFRPTLSHEPSSLGPTVWKDNYLPKQPSSSFKMDIDFGKLGIYSAMIIAVISYLSF